MELLTPTERREMRFLRAVYEQHQSRATAWEQWRAELAALQPLLETPGELASFRAEMALLQAYKPRRLKGAEQPAAR